MIDSPSAAETRRISDEQILNRGGQLYVDSITIGETKSEMDKILAKEKTDLEGADEFAKLMAMSRQLLLNKTETLSLEDRKALIDARTSRQVDAMKVIIAKHDSDMSQAIKAPAAVALDGDASSNTAMNQEKTKFQEQVIWVKENLTKPDFCSIATRILSELIRDMTTDTKASVLMLLNLCLDTKIPSWDIPVFYADLFRAVKSSPDQDISGLTDRLKQKIKNEFSDRYTLAIKEYPLDKYKNKPYSYGKSREVNFWAGGNENVYEAYIELIDAITNP